MADTEREQILGRIENAIRCQLTNASQSELIELLLAECAYLRAQVATARTLWAQDHCDRGNRWDTEELRALEDVADEWQARLSRPLGAKVAL